MLFFELQYCPEAKSKKDKKLLPQRVEKGRKFSDPQNDTANNPKS